MISQKDDKIEYTYTETTIVAILMNETNEKYTVNNSSFMETFSLKQGIKKVGQKGDKPTYGEILQPHQITCFKPIRVSGLNPRERKRALE